MSYNSDAATFESIIAPVKGEFNHLGREIVINEAMKHSSLARLARHLLRDPKVPPRIQQEKMECVGRRFGITRDEVELALIRKMQALLQREHQEWMASDGIDDIIEANNLRDIAVEAAASDEHLIAVMGSYLIKGRENETLQADYDETVDQVTIDYGLLPDQVIPMLNLCEANIAKELSHGEA